MNNVVIAIMAFLAIGTLWGETFTWKHSKSYSDSAFANPEWKEFGDWNNWAVGSSKNDTNPNNIVPSIEDSIRFSDSKTIKSFDLKNSNHILGRLSNGKVWSNRYILLKNGVFGFSNSFTNYSAQIHIFADGKFVLGPDCGSRCGQMSYLMR